MGAETEIVTDRTSERFARAHDFITALKAEPNVTAAAEAAGIGRTTAYEWRVKDPEFAAAWDDALESAVDKLEAVAFQRAYAGESDRMMEILLKAHRPKYREKQVIEHSGTIQHDHRAAAEAEIAELFGGNAALEAPE